MGLALMHALAVDLTQLMKDTRERTLRLVADLSDEQLIGPSLPIVNPMLWEIGHLAWFQERWVLRHLRGEGPLWKEADALYDSARVPHQERWTLPLPSRSQTLVYMQRVLDNVLDRLAKSIPAEEEYYFHHLAAFHEDMHGEAFTYTRQTLGYPPPRLGRPGGNGRAGEAAAGPPAPGDVEVPGGTFLLGATPTQPFVFDNEKWAHEVRVGPFRISRTQVTNEEFRRFVEADGYRRPEFWSEAGGQWRAAVNARHPVSWVRNSDGQWYCRHYDHLLPLAPELPVIFVNWYEAEAYCRWARRRLPTEAEWEMAASAEPEGGGKAIGPHRRRYPWGDEPPDGARAHLDGWTGGCIPVQALPAGDSAFGCRQMIGNVWEWTASDFEPYPGFSVDPYKEYSQPWFGGTHKVLRGGAFATRSRLVHNVYRNFYTPDRRDVLAGFRTCAL
jgi:gamma-glutamyl hercynylcysteine S-oxide synthase